MTRIQLVLFLVCSFAIVINCLNTVGMTKKEVRRQLRKSDDLENIVKDLEGKRFLADGRNADGNFNLDRIAKALLHHDRVMARKAEKERQERKLENFVGAVNKHGMKEKKDKDENEPKEKPEDKNDRV